MEEECTSKHEGQRATGINCLLTETAKQQQQHRLQPLWGLFSWRQQSNKKENKKNVQHKNCLKARTEWMKIECKFKNYKFDFYC